MEINKKLDENKNEDKEEIQKRRQRKNYVDQEFSNYFGQDIWSCQVNNTLLSFPTLL